MIRLGVIGCGYWGPNLIRNFAELPDVELVAVAELREDRRAYVRTRHPQVRVVDDYRDFFALNLDAVTVATPPTTHYAIARDCLLHGLSVLIEKPMTLRSSDAEDLIALAEQRGLVLMVGHTFEYNPAVQALKRIIDSGELGDVYYISTMRLNLGLFQRDLNVLWDLAPHDISILLYLLDREPVTVSASGGAYILNGVQDIAFLCLKFPGQVMAHTRVSWLDPRKERTVTVVGSRKMIVYDDVAASEKIKIYDKGVEVPPYTDTFGEFQLQYHHGDIVTPHLSFAEPLRLECQHFVDCVANGTQPQSDGYDGLTVVRILEAAERSLRNGGAQEPYLISQEAATWPQ